MVRIDSIGSTGLGSPRWIHRVSYGTRSTCARCSAKSASTDGGSASSPSRARYASRSSARCVLTRASLGRLVDDHDVQHPDQHLELVVGEVCAFAPRER